MNENAKTMVFVGVALALLLVALMSPPAQVADVARLDDGKSLFPDFSDPQKAASLDIMEFDEGTATFRPFQVAKTKGVWSIPSHDGYPADASRQLAQALAAVIEIQNFAVVTDDASQHELYGVIDPDPKKLDRGTTGVGKRITVENKDRKRLANVIIGKHDKDQPELHFVRVPGQDRVYRAKIRDDALTTRFEDWIEEDLLKLNAFEIKQVFMNDYSIDELQGALLPRSRTSVEYDTKDAKWKLLNLQAFEEGDFRDVPLAENEELDAQQLNDLKTAVDDLKIVDVRRKPAGLSRDLRAAKELTENPEALESLVRRGFRVAFNPLEEELQVLSNEGEVRVGMKDGVEYMLRFGRIAGRGHEEQAEQAADAADGEPADEDQETGENRYLLVTAQFNESLIAKPDLEPLPGGEAPSDQDADAADEDAPEGGKSESEKAEDAEGDDAGAADASTEGKAEEDEDGKAAEDKAAKDDKAAAERKRIEKENKRKQKEYDEQVKQGREKVEELSDRFADWYYIISDKTYQKIHLGRDQIVKEKEQETKDAAGDPPQADDATESDEDDLTLDPLRELPKDGELPGDEAPADEAPADEAPADEAPVDDAPADEPPVDDAPADEAPVDDAPADEPPVDDAPADDASADEASPDEEPATP